MKRVSIFGKKNTDALHPERQAKRSATENWPNQDYIFDSAQQVNIVNQLWMNQQFAGCENVRREIANKLSGYRNQDQGSGNFNKGYATLHGGGGAGPASDCGMVEHYY